MCLCSKQSSSFSFYALSSGGKSKGAKHNLEEIPKIKKKIEKMFVLMPVAAQICKAIIFKVKLCKMHNKCCFKRWIRLCIHSCGPGFESQAHYLYFIVNFCPCIDKRTKMNNNVRVWPTFYISKIQTSSNKTL